MDGVSDPGLDAARARVAAVLESLRRIDLQVVVVARPDATRQAARTGAREAAVAAGRGPLLDEATAEVADAVMRMFSRAGFSGTWAVTDMAVSVARAEDRVAAAAAFEEEAMAAVVEDLVDDGTLDVLRATAAEFRDMAGLPSPGSLATIATPPAGLEGPWATVVVVVMVVVIVVGAFAFGSATGAIVALFGAAVIAGLIRRHRRAGDAGDAGPGR